MNRDAAQFHRLVEDRFVERYEAVRKGRASDGAGRALLVHWGLVAWMEACSSCMATKPPVREVCPSRDATVAALDAESLVPPAVRTEFVRVLAGMVSGICGR